MDIKLYVNNSSVETVNKNITSEISLSGVLRNESNVVEPTITIETSNISNYNYAYIPNFGRYYFIREMVSIRNNIWEIKLKTDVLMTYKSQIKNLTAIIERQRNYYNLYLPDDKFRVEQRQIINTYPFPNSIGKDTKYILTVAG